MDIAAEKISYINGEAVSLCRLYKGTAYYVPVGRILRGRAQQQQQQRVKYKQLCAACGLGGCQIPVSSLVRDRAKPTKRAVPSPLWVNMLTDAYSVLMQITGYPRSAILFFGRNTMRQIEIVADFANMYRSYRRVRSCNVGKMSALRFEANALDGIDRLQNSLLDGTYRLGKYIVFNVTYPKAREVKACAFKDKIVNNSTCNNVLWPMIDKYLIKDNYASRKGMGTSAAVRGFRQQLHDYYLNYGNVGYCLKLDVKGYFYNINLEILKEQMRGYDFDESILNLLDIIIDSMWNEERNGKRYGIPIGNPSSQFFGVEYANVVDHFIKDQLGQKYYGRYMDDSVILGKSKIELNEIKELIREKYAELDLELNSKSQDIPLHKGITYLGKRFELAPNGKITERLTSQNIRHRYTEIHKKAALVALGEMTTEEYWTSFIAWNGYAKHSDTYKTRMRLYDYAKEALKNALAQELRSEHSYKLGIPIRS